MTQITYSYGELCPQTQDGGVSTPPSESAKTTDSGSGAVMSGLLPEDEAAASLIAVELRRIRMARWTGATRTARRHLDRLVDFVWFSDDGGAA